MSLTGLMLITNSELFHIYGLWVLGALMVVGLFLVNRALIKRKSENE